MKAHPLQSNMNPSAAPPLSLSLNQQSIYSVSTGSRCVCTCMRTVCMCTQTIWTLINTKLSQGRWNYGMNLRQLSGDQIYWQIKRDMLSAMQTKKKKNPTFQCWHVKETTDEPGFKCETHTHVFIFIKLIQIRDTQRQTARKRQVLF